MDFLDFENKFGFEHNHESQTDILKKNIVELEKQLEIDEKEKHELKDAYFMT